MDLPLDERTRAAKRHGSHLDDACRIPMTGISQQTGLNTFDAHLKNCPQGLFVTI